MHAAPSFATSAGPTTAGESRRGARRTRPWTVVTGGPSDRAYLDAVWAGTEVLRLDGQLTWPEVSALIAAARVYVGADTAVTHLAAATGRHTVHCTARPIRASGDPGRPAGSTSHGLPPAPSSSARNVWLVQNPLPCLPCQQEGCERRLDSYSQCLDELSVAQVMSAVDSTRPRASMGASGGRSKAR